MTLVTTTQLIASARERSSGLAAFNVITLEHAEAIVRGAEQSQSDVLLQISQNAIRYHGAAAPIVRACAALADASSARIGIHLDHLDDLTLVGEMIEAAHGLGVSSLMIDASRLSDDENVRVTRELGARAHAAGLWVEAELGEIGGKDGAHAPGVRTDPRDAADFVSATSVDGLAVAVGSSHAMATRTAEIDIALVRRLADSVPVPLVLHGSSGISDDVIASAIAAGIRKVNVGTALNVAYSGAIRAALDADAMATDPRRALSAARDAMTTTVAQLCTVIAG